MEIKKNYTFTVGTVNDGGLRIRSNKDQLIADIVNATTEKNKKKLAKVLALTYNALNLSEIDLHALLQKKNDPSIRNYTAFVWYSCKIRGNENNHTPHKTSTSQPKARTRSRTTDTNE